MTDPRTALQRTLRELNPGQLRRVILVLALAVPAQTVELALRAVTSYEAPKMEGQLDIGV